MFEKKKLFFFNIHYKRTASPEKINEKKKKKLTLAFFIRIITTVINFITDPRHWYASFVRTSKLS